MDHYIQTPLIPSRTLTQIVDRPVFLKLDNFQISGSCKDRGVGHFCRNAAKLGAKQFIVSPGAHAALAVAHAGRIYGVPVHAILPLRTSPLLLRRLADMGATCAQHGDTWAATEAFARAWAAQAGGVWVPGYDHPDVWEGHSTVIDEIAMTGICPGTIVLAVGGGGLLCGVIRGLQRAGWAETAIVAAELKSTASLHASMQAPEAVEISHPSQLRSAAAGPGCVARQALEDARTHCVTTSVVDAPEAMAACGRFAGEHAMEVDPLTGAVLSVIYSKPALLNQYDSVVVIVGGGESSGWQQPNADAGCGEILAAQHSNRARRNTTT